jgi:hypothetical protein
MPFHTLITSCAAAAPCAALSVQLPDAARGRRTVLAGIPQSEAAVIVLDRGG